MSALRCFLPASIVSNTINLTLCSLNMAFTLKVDPDYFVALYSLYGAAMGIYLSAQVILLIDLINAKTQRRLRLMDELAETLSVDRIRSVRTQVIMTSLQEIFWICIIIVYAFDIVHEFRDTHDLACPSTQCNWYAIAFAFANAEAIVVMAQTTTLAVILYRVSSVPHRHLHFSSLLDLDITELMTLREETRRLRRNLRTLPRRNSGVVSQSMGPGTEYAGGPSAGLRAEAISLSYMLDSPPISVPDTLYGRRRTGSTGLGKSLERSVQHLTLEEANTAVTSPKEVDSSLPPIIQTEEDAGMETELPAHEAGPQMVVTTAGFHQPLNMYALVARPHSVDSLRSVSLESPVVSDQDEPYTKADDPHLTFETASPQTPSDPPLKIDARSANAIVEAQSLKPAFHPKADDATSDRRSVPLWETFMPHSRHTLIENPFEYEDTPEQTPKASILYSPESRYSTQSVYHSTPTVIRRQLARMIGMPETPETPDDDAVKTPRD